MNIRIETLLDLGIGLRASVQQLLVADLSGCAAKYHSGNDYMAAADYGSSTAMSCNGHSSAPPRHGGHFLACSESPLGLAFGTLPLQTRTQQD